MAADPRQLVGDRRPEAERSQRTASALWGMPRYFADCSSWTKVMPPSALIARRPSVPSEPVPDSTTPIARPSASFASERKKWSIGVWRSTVPREREREGAVADRHVRVGRDHVDVVRLHAQAVGDRQDGHHRSPGQDLGELARVLGIQVLNEHERHAGVGGKLPQELAEGLQPAGRGSDTDDREGGPSGSLRGAMDGRRLGGDDAGYPLGRHTLAGGRTLGGARRS